MLGLSFSGSTSQSWGLPTKVVTCGIPVCSDRVAKALHFRDQFIARHRIEVGIHLSAPSGFIAHGHSLSSDRGMSSSIITGAWSLVCSQLLGFLRTLADLNHGATVGLSSK